VVVHVVTVTAVTVMLKFNVQVVRPAYIDEAFSFIAEDA
jgi:hypothetical protein